MSWWQLVPADRRLANEIAVAPSILSADFSRLADEIAEAERAGADLLHLDVMDGHFVPNLTFGPLVVEAVHRAAARPLDTHLMIEKPDQFIDRFLDSGSDIVTLHIEASTNIERDLKMIAARGAKTGVSINPDTPVDRTWKLLEKVDLLLLMSVYPGFGGQEFIESVLEKISAARDFREKEGLGFAIEVDGGIHPGNAKQVREAGVDIIVAGTAVFKSSDYRRAILDLRGS